MWRRGVFLALQTLPRNILSELHHQLGLFASFLKICMVLDMFWIRLYLLCVRYRSPMDLRQSPSRYTILHYTLHSQSPFLSLSHLQHFSIRPCSPCLTLHPYVPCFTYPFPCHYDPLISRLSFLPPVPVFSCFMLVPFVPSPWPSQANPAA